jgi:hypothetical protein
MAEAKSRYEQRRWIETRKALIQQAYRQAQNSNVNATADFEKERALRRESFFWKQATSVNTMESFQDYVDQYPKGKHAREAGLELQRRRAQGETLTPRDNIAQ